jgi:branched-chain amino acid transport system ATP-binding protein
MTAILALRKVDAAYASTQILRAVDLIVEARGITTLLGANGAGKTTTLRAISNMMVRVSGEIWFAGERIDGKATEDIARLGVAHVPDGRGTFLDLTVEENLRIGAYARRGKGSKRI